MGCYSPFVGGKASSRGGILDVHPSRYSMVTLKAANAMIGRELLHRYCTQRVTEYG